MTIHKGQKPVLFPRVLPLIGKALLLLTVLFSVLGLVIKLVDPQPVQAATTSSTINFQARLLQNSGAVVPDGNYHVEFKLYDTVASGGSAQGVCSLNSSTDDCWWVETRTTGNLVRVVNGYLTVNLGSLTAFGASIPWDRELWLTMNIGGTSGPSWDGEMSPRIKLTAVPYAFRAAQLVSHNGTQTGTLAFGSVTNSPALTLPNETGTVCTNAATGACTATGGFVQLQSATPGTQQTGNLNISGTGILGTQLQTPAILAPAGLTIQATGTNTLSLNTTGAGTLNLGTSNTTVVGLGNTGAVLTVEGSSAAGGIIIGNGATNHGIQIGTSSSGDNDIVIGSTNSGSTISLEGGTAANSIAIGNAATAHNIAIGNASGANNTVVGIGSGTTGGSNTSVITIGSANAANSTLLLQGGNNTGAVSIQAATSGTISIGTTNNNPINIGSTSTNSQINIGQATGANSNTIAIGATIGNTGTQTINLGYNSSPTAGSTTNVNIGSTIAGTTAVQGATTVTNRTSGSADTLVVSNNTSTGTIALFKDNSSVVLQIADGGGAIFTNQTNSATAFQIQNATNADQLFTVDTTARGAGGGNLIKIGNSTGTDTATTVLKLDDSNGALSTNLAALNGGLYYNSAIGHVQVIEGGAVKTLCNLTDLGCASTTLQNAYDNDANGGDAIIPLTSADGGIIIRNPVSSGSGSTYNLVLDQLATGANGGLSIQSAGTSNLLLITDTTSTARDVLTIADTGITTFRNQTDSTAAFKVQNAAGTNILNTDTTNQRVVIGSNQTNSTGQLFLAGFANPVQVGETQGTVPGTSLNGPTSIAVQGRYAYITAYDNDSLAVLDVSNPASPTQVGETKGSVPGTSLDGAKSIVVQGKYAFVSVDNHQSVAVIDISNPTSPVMIAETRGRTPGSSLDNVSGLALSGKYLYAAAWNSKMFTVIDISNPYNPTEVSELQSNTYLDGANYVAVQGKYAYVAAQNVDALTIIDVSNPYNPVIAGSLIDSTNLDEITGVAVSGKYAYVSAKTSAKFAVIDISNPASPTLTGSTGGTTPGTSLAKASSVTLADRYAYVTTRDRDSVAVIDVSSPASPTMVGETRGNTPGTSLDGAERMTISGRYGYVVNGPLGSGPSNRDSLVILDLGGTYSTSIESGSVDTTDLRTNSLSVQQYATFNSGLQASGGVQITGNLGVQGPATFASDINSQTNVNGSKIGFQIQDANAGQILNVNTTSLMNLLSNGSFENGNAVTAVPGWAKLNGAETTFQTATSQFYYGAASLNVVTAAATANQGAKYVYQFKPNTTYSFSIYAKHNSGSMATFDLGTSINGSVTTCISGQTVVNTAWTRFSCSFTTGTTTLTTDYVFARNSSTTTQNFFLDGALLQLGSSATPYVEPPSPNLITNHGIENNTNGFSLRGTAVSIAPSTDTAYSGKQALKLTLSAAGTTDGVNYSIPLLATTNYSFSFYARLLTGTTTDMNVGRRENGSDTDITGCTAQTLSNSTWTRYTCSWTTGTTVDSNTSLYIRFTTSASNRVIYLDGFQLETASSATPYYDTQNNLQVDTLTSNITINGSQSGDIQAWKRNANRLPEGRVFGNVVTANGYMYYFGGGDNTGATPDTDVYYAKLNADGSVGTFSAASSLPAGRVYGTSAYLNGYIYLIGGGSNSSTPQSTVYYAKVNQDGTLGAWRTNTVNLPQTFWKGTSLTYNGYLYAIGGNMGGSNSDDYWYVKPNVDGSLPNWTAVTSNPMPAVRLFMPVNGIQVNGYVYILAGHNGTSTTTTAYYARLNSDGTLGTWASTTSLPAVTSYNDPSAATINGYIYFFSTDGPTGNTTYYAKANADGTLGSWLAPSNEITDEFVLGNTPTAVSNGYIYRVGGNNANNVQDTVYYTSTARTLTFGSLDLVGLSGQNLAEGNTGGQLTAGNTSIVGTLNVQDQASFNQSVSVQGELNAFSHVDVPGYNNPVQVGETQGTTPNTSLDGAETVVVAGRYAYVTNWNRSSLAVIDVSNPASPTQLSETLGTTPGTSLAGAIGLAVNGRYAYVASETRDSLAVIDISNPLAPVQIGETRGTIPGTSLDGAHDVKVVGRYAYVLAKNQDAFVVIDISDPTHPVQVGTTQGTTPGTSLDQTVRLDVVGKYAYVTALGSGRFVVIDISNPYNPIEIAETQGSNPGTTFGNIAGVVVVGRYAYVTSLLSDSLSIVDVSNPYAPTMISETKGTIPNTSMDGATGISVAGHYAYVTNVHRDSVVVIDISNPLVPVQVGETRGNTAGTSLDGAEYITISGRYAYVSDGTWGTGPSNHDALVILDIGGTYSTSIEAGSVDTTDLRTNSLTVQQYATFNSGLQASGGVQVTGNLGVQGPATFTSDTTNNTSGSKIGFQIQDANAGQILNVNTTSLMNLLSNGSFENGNAVTPPGWLKINGGETTFLTSTAQSVFGTTSLNVVTDGTNIDEGTKYIYQFKPNTDYSFSIYARTSSGSFNTFAMGAIINGVTKTCPSSQTVTVAWSRFTCSFNSGATVGTNDIVYARRATAAVQNFFLDGALLQLGSSATPYVEPPSPNLITNHSIESNTNGWTATANAGSSMGASRDVVYSGQQSLKFALSTATSNDKITYSIPLTVSTTYTFSFYSRLLTGSATDMTIGYQTASSDVNSCAGNTLSNSVWTRYTCSFTTSTTAPDSNTNLFVKFTTSGASRVAYFDGFQLETAAAATPYYDTQNNLQVDTLTSNITINGSQSGEIQPWKLNAVRLPAVRNFGASVVANGYIYYIAGGSNSTPNATNNVYYAKLNTDGSVGTFNSTSSLPANRSWGTGSYLNGYIYWLGGWDGSTAQSQVYYSKVNQDGTLGTWQTNAVNLPQSHYQGASLAYNGFLYIVAGVKNGADSGTIWYVRPNADGSLGSWLTASNGLPGGQNRKIFAINAIELNGYMYVIGGSDGASWTTTSYYAKLNTDGSVGVWNSTSTLPAAPEQSLMNATLNGYIYVNGWSSTQGQLSFYAKSNADGTLSAWRPTSVPGMDPVGGGITVTSNGYIYKLGGNTGGTIQSSVYYTSGARTLAFGSLDLVGLSGQNLNEGNSGGSLTAGNTSIVGSLNVQDQASFAQSVAVSGDLNAFAHLSVPGFNNPVEVGETQGTTAGTSLDGANAVAVQGKYAYVAAHDNDSLVVLDISNPVAPVQVGQTQGLIPNTSLDGAKSILVQGKYAYVGTENHSSIAVIDISNPASPTMVGETQGAISGTSLSNPDALAISGRYLYVGCWNGRTVTVIDISNPYAPTETTEYQSNTFFDGANDLAIQGKYLYLAAQNVDALTIVDISNPHNLTIVGSVTNASLDEITGVAVNGRYAYVSVKTGTSSNGSFAVIDVSNPASPTITGITQGITPGTSLVKASNVALAGHYAYVTTRDRDSVAVMDVSNPANPIMVGEARGYTPGTSLDGAQDIVIAGRYAYVADGPLGAGPSNRDAMVVLDLGGTYSTGIEAGSVDATNVRAGSFTATANASFGSGVQISGGLEVAGGVGLRGNLTLQADSSATTSVLHVNTISNNMNLIVNGDFEQNVNGWSPKGTPTAGPTYDDATGNKVYGRASLTFTTGAASQGVMYNYQFVPSAAYMFTFWAKSSVSQSYFIGSDENGTAGDECTATIGTSWAQYSCALAIGATVGTNANFYIRQNGAGTPRVVNIDGALLIASGGNFVYAQFAPMAENLSVESVNDNITINGVNSGEVQPWLQNSTSLGATTPGDTTANKVVARQGAASVVSNGFMYVVGGYDGTNVLNSILYAKMNADGSLGNWNCQGTNVATSCGTAATAINANSLPGARRLAAATVANGYIYAIGGVDGTPTAQSTIYYAKLNGDGSTGTWQTNAYGVGQNVTTAAAARVALSVVVRDGFIYTLGGCSDSSANCATPITTTNYAKLYADGGIGPWTTTTVLPAARGMGSATIANGFVYYLGGFNSTAQTAVYAAPINTDGTIGSWNSGITPPVLLANRTQQTTVVANGYIYVIGGCNALTTGSCTNAAATTSTVYYAKLNPTNGNLGAWNTGANALPAPRGGQSTAIANGYIYVLGGYDGAARAANVLYSSTSRVLVGGSLDLVGLSGGSLSDYSGAGALTAGNGRFIGDLKVDGFADFNNGISVDSAININAISANSGQTVFNINNTNSNSIFSIRHMSTNFGSLVSAGAFMAKNSYWAEEYNIAQQGNVAMTLSAAQFACAWARGDTGGHVTQAPVTCSSTADSNSGQGGMTISANLQAATTDACTPSQPAGANGLETITATAVNTAAHSASCSEYPTGGVTGASSNFLTATNLPVMTLKVRPSTLASNAGIRVFAGMWSGGKAPAAGTLPGTAASTWGAYFTNCSTTAPACSNTTWYGWVANASATLLGSGSANASVTCPATQALSTTNFAYMRIEFRTATEVHFYIDANTADGINEVECGTGVSSGSINAGAMTPFVQAVNSVNATGATTVLDVDYLRTWQDDNVDMSTVEVSPGSTNTGSGQDGEDLQTLPPLSPESADPNVLGSFFNFNAATSEDSVFNHNVYIKGTLYVDKIRANEIEGLEVFTDKLSSLQAELAARAAENGEGSNSEENSDDTSNVPLGAPGLNLSGLVLGATTVNFDLNVNGALTIGGDANFHGNVFFYKLVTFVEKTVFNNDITLKGHLITDGANPDTTLLPAAGLTASNDPNANLASVAIDGNDTNGLISITLGDNATPGELVKVSFKRPYTKAPRLFLTASDNIDAGTTYFAESTPTGFTIVVNASQLTPGTTLKLNYWSVQGNTTASP